MNPTPDAAFIYSLVDLTSLSGTETDGQLAALAENATCGTARVAALCVYPEFLSTIRRFAPKGMPLAAVTNFPDGGRDPERADAETRNAVSLGAAEIDYVLPYKALMQGDVALVREVLQRQRIACGGARLKVIIESGVLETPALIAQASELSLEAGADFLKTSTGKVPVNATLAAAGVMLNVLAAAGRPAGFKAAGGLKTPEEARAYITLANRIMPNGIQGNGWVTPDVFRIGASGLAATLRPLIKPAV